MALRSALRVQLRVPRPQPLGFEEHKSAGQEGRELAWCND